MSGTAGMGWSWGFGLLAIAGIALIISVVVRLLANRTDTAAAKPEPMSPEPVGCG
ncbi:hypothetical protein [Cryobacterium sp. MLB-32]|uniref:hypothetical protein n=1 Tax=Cryobacterium sp. MLB-32 TaxID=1529318 RepID=UPI001E595F8A|nr:hypothetical protein [Cryobacterium sp. MLB-32]